MIRNLRILWLALVAMFAMGTISASPALAVDVFTTASPTGDAWLTGTTHDKSFEITGAEVGFECTTSTFIATVDNGASQMTVDATYTGTLGTVPPHSTHCTSTFGTMVIDMNGCGYMWTGNTTGDHNGKTDVDATVWTHCEKAGEEITITDSTGCTVHIPPQTPTEGGITYTNLPTHPGGESIRVNTTITGVTYKATGFICALGGLPSHGNDLEYTGTVTLTGYEDKGGAHKTNNVTEGARTPVKWS